MALQPQFRVGQFETDIFKNWIYYRLLEALLSGLRLAVDEILVLQRVMPR